MSNKYNSKWRDRLIRLGVIPSREDIRRYKEDGTKPNLPHLYNIVLERIINAPGYREDYENLSISTRDQIIKKWGFYPLIDPDAPNVSFEFFDLVCDYFRRDEYPPLVTCRGHETILYYERRKDGYVVNRENHIVEGFDIIPSHLIFDVDITASTQDLVRQFQDLVMHLKYIYNIKNDPIPDIDPLIFLVDFFYVRQELPLGDMYKTVIAPENQSGENYRTERERVKRIYDQVRSKEKKIRKV